jgi:AbrB family looped-hinge helix DNA binding protein
VEHLIAALVTKGQLAIPKILQDRLHLREGTQVMLTVEGDEIRIRKADNWRELRGILADADIDPRVALSEERTLDRLRERG